MPTKYHDIADEPEDDRIAKIGDMAMNLRKVVGFIMDDEPGKPERYISKLQERFPGIVVIARGKGPVESTVWVKVGPPGPLVKEDQ